MPQMLVACLLDQPTHQTNKLNHVSRRVSNSVQLSLVQVQKFELGDGAAGVGPIAELVSAAAGDGSQYNKTRPLLSIFQVIVMCLVGNSSWPYGTDFGPPDCESCFLAMSRLRTCRFKPALCVSERNCVWVAS
jgi:hypothetical protein